MSSATKVSSTAAIRYAAALLDLAQKKKSLDTVSSDLKELQNMIKGSDDLTLLIASPLFNKKQKQSAMMALAEQAGFDALTKNFLNVLIANTRLGALGQIIKAFDKEAARRRGELTVDVKVAQKLSAAQEKDLQDKISKSVGAKVTLNVKVEPGIIGGMIVTVGSQMIDDSVARKLERLKSAMSKQANTNDDHVSKTA